LSDWQTNNFNKDLIMVPISTAARWRSLAFLLV